MAIPTVRTDSSSRNVTSAGNPAGNPAGITAGETAGGDAAHPPPSEVSLLRLATAGSVDDGKSTLVGRLLHDSSTLHTDQWEAVARVSRERGQDVPDLAMLTDGLRAEREQGITIDVAYRYFATSRRRFILADTPGHVQYTRNMVTGASTAELAVVLVDARTGMLDQTRRHATVAALLRVPHIVLAVNKMDLVGYDEEVFAGIAEEFTRYAASLGVPEITAIPLSALHGDNVVHRSSEMSWYTGPPLLEHLERVEVASQASSLPARFPVQYVIRRGAGDRRGYAGQLAAGTLRVGQEVVALPSGRTSRISRLDVLGRLSDRAWAPQSVSVYLEDELDVARGDMIVPCDAAPALVRDATALVCHLAEQPLTPGRRLLLRHATRTVRATVDRVLSRIELDDLRHHPEPGSLEMNDIGRVVLRTSEPLPFDDYALSRRTGSFLLIDPADGATLCAGMIGEGFGATGE